VTLYWAHSAWADYQYWAKHSPDTHKRINQLVRAIQRQPESGLGAPVPLQAGWEGFWSRRIDGKHRLVYRVQGQRLCIAQCRYYDGYFLASEMAADGLFNPRGAVSAKS
jgi:toxin YoeB